jgi:hypothetical protein
MTEPNLNELLAKAQEAQTKLASLQQELARRSVEAAAGGGMVVAKASGELRILEIRIEPTLLETGDREMIQDLTAAAVNAALASAQRMVQEEFQRASIGFQIPGMPGAPGTGS